MNLINHLQYGVYTIYDVFVIDDTDTNTNSKHNKNGSLMYKTGKG